ncbi:MAG: 3'-5' exonuclease [Clostridia bacterium]|nr:3'-5' exonuclease [Clostridia bacterium]
MENSNIAVASTPRQFKGKSLDNLVNDYVLVDIETTGLSPQKDDIIEIGAIKVKDNKIVDTYSSLINIGRKVPSYITNLTGITTDMLESDGKNVCDVLQEFVNFTGDNIIVGHNVNFDINFIYDKCEKYLDKPLSNDFIDTMKIAKRLVDTPNYKLGTLADHFNVDYNGAHRGLKDVEITYEVYNNLKNI